MTNEYPIGAVAKATGLSVDTLRAWERRYNAVMPAHSERGRVYGDAEIRRLMLLKRAVDGGHPIGQVAGLRDAELEELNRQAQCYEGEGEPADTAAELKMIVAAMAACDVDATNEELGRLAALMRPTDLVHRVVLPLMRHAGRNWEKGRLQVAQEHALSACVRNLLGALLRLGPRGQSAGLLLLTTPSGELHEFGILAAALLAAGHGFRVAYLGPNLPAREILYAAGRNVPRVVVLGLMKTNATRTVRADVQRLARDLDPRTELWMGGGGAEEASRGIGRVLRLDDFASFEKHLERITALSRAS